MVLGLKKKTIKSPFIQLDYVINLVEIKPWPPSQSLRSLRSALIQWEHGDKNSGCTKAVAPTVSGSGVGDGKIEFNESFTLHVTLSRDTSTKAGDNEAFLRNCIEFNMYEPRRDKALKGQLLATGIIDFAEYGVVKESLMIGVPMTCKRTFGNTAQPMLFVKMQTSEKNYRVRSSLRDSFIREGSLDTNRSESVSVLMNEEYAEEAETASVTDDDLSSQSSMVASSTFGWFENSIPQTENGSEAKCRSSGKVNDQEVSVQDKNATESFYPTNVPLSGSSCTLPTTALYSELENTRTTVSYIRNTRLTMLPEKPEPYNVKLSKPSIANVGTNDGLNGNLGNNTYVNPHEKVLESAPIGKDHIRVNAQESHVHEVDNEQSCIQLNDPDASQSDLGSQITGDLGLDVNADGLKSIKFVGSSLDSGFSNGSVRSSKSLEKFKEVGVHMQNGERNLTSNEVGVHTQNGERNLTSNEGKDASKVQHLERRIQFLEGELREAAAMEVSLYSVVAEHVSSVNKVHAPARRLARLYFHARKQNSWSRTARSIVSGLILVAKACGNDVPRLTFWLSNSVVLRAIIHETCNELEDPCTVSSNLEKVESWIFTRIIESIWWQTLAPYMQSTAAKGIIRVHSESNIARETAFGSHDHEQVNSLEFWKTAFMDAFERICPVRAAGHDCGCLRMLSTSIMDQCMRRLDVAMFNAILRESADEVPTDPVSDPISDVGVLPIPSGKASFGAGAQLKKTIGNWSRWLTDHFGMDQSDYENEGGYDEPKIGYDTSFNSFHLLGALSELMMLPKDMLLSNTIRKEVCPAFGVPLIKRIVDSFVPDEFCPDPIPEVVLEALDSEDLIASSEDCVIGLPCAAAPIAYDPPSASLIRCILRDDECSGSWLVRKSNTSDDELDELDSPLTSFLDSFRASRKPIWTLSDHGNRNVVRYDLLREVWMSSELVSWR